MCSGEKSAEQKSLRALPPLPDGNRRFLLPGFLVCQPSRTMSTSQIAIRIGGNPNHHLWNNNGTWWIHYTEHLPDYTKRRVRRSLGTQSVIAARSIRDRQLFAGK